LTLAAQSGKWHIAAVCPDRDQSKIRSIVFTHQPPFIFRLIRQFGFDGIGVSNDVIVREDFAVFADENTRTQAALAVLFGRRFAKEAIKELLNGIVRAATPGTLRRCSTVDDRRHGSLGDGSE